MLDHVVAVINGSVILESDVQEEMRYGVLQPFSVNPARNTPQRALQRLIDRALILQQMQATQSATPPTPEEVQQRLKELRAVIPECARYAICDAETGWQASVKARGLTEEKMDKHWTERMTIFRIPLALRLPMVGTAQEIADYYHKTLVPRAPRPEAATLGRRSPATSRRSCCNSE